MSSYFQFGIALKKDKMQQYIWVHWNIDVEIQTTNLILNLNHPFVSEKLDAWKYIKLLFVLVFFLCLTECDLLKRLSSDDSNSVKAVGEQVSIEYILPCSLSRRQAVVPSPCSVSSVKQN